VNNPSKLKSLGGIDMKTFRVYLADGNQKLYQTDNIFNLIQYLCWYINIDAEDIKKIEEVE
jgi:hypothetical protein